MIGLLIITHETLGTAYTALAGHFFPDNDFNHIRIIGVDKHHDHEDVLTQAKALLPELDKGHGVLICADIFGATPCNAALKLVTPQQSAIITGLNAPMLIKAVSHSYHAQDLNAFVEAVKEAGVHGIMTFTEQPL